MAGGIGVDSRSHRSCRCQMGPVPARWEDASKALMTGAALLQRAWFQAAVNIGQVISKQQPVSHGAFDDLRRLREQVEELDRANTAITRISMAQAQMQADEATKN